MECENCGEECERDEVDVGVGVIYGPYGCYACGWSEDPAYDSSKGVSPKQQVHPDSWVDPCGGLTPLKGINRKLRRFGLPEIQHPQ